MFETFRISFNPFDYLPQPTPLIPVSTITTHDLIKDFMRGIERDANNFPKCKDEINGMNSITKPKHEIDPNL